MDPVLNAPEDISYGGAIKRHTLPNCRLQKCKSQLTHRKTS